MRPLRLLLAVLVLPVVLGGCLLGRSSRGGYPEAPLTLAEARARWAAHGARDYTMVLERVCLLCGPDARGPFRVTVRGGDVAAVAPVGIAARPLTPAVADSLRAAYGLTVEDAFRQIEAAYARRADVVRVSYDAWRGHPLVVYVDDDGRAGQAPGTGGPFGLRITGLTPEEASAPTSAASRR